MDLHLATGLKYCHLMSPWSNQGQILFCFSVSLIKKTRVDISLDKVRVFHCFHPSLSLGPSHYSVKYQLLSARYSQLYFSSALKFRFERTSKELCWLCNILRTTLNFLMLILPLSVIDLGIIFPKKIYKLTTDIIYLQNITYNIML